MITIPNDISGIVPFCIDNMRFALPLHSVVRVLPIVEITPLPGAPAVIAGMINLHGAIIPVADIRKRMDMPARKQTAADMLIIVKTALRTLAVISDEVEGVINAGPQELRPADEVAPAPKYIKGVAKTASGLTLIYDMDAFLSLEEEAALDRALKAKEKNG